MGFHEFGDHNRIARDAARRRFVAHPVAARAHEARIEDTVVGVDDALPGPLSARNVDRKRLRPVGGAEGGPTHFGAGAHYSIHRIGTTIGGVHNGMGARPRHVGLEEVTVIVAQAHTRAAPRALGGAHLQRIGEVDRPVARAEAEGIALGHDGGLHHHRDAAIHTAIGEKGQRVAGAIGQKGGVVGARRAVGDGQAGPEAARGGLPSTGQERVALLGAGRKVLARKDRTHEDLLRARTTVDLVIERMQPRPRLVRVELTGIRIRDARPAPGAAEGRYRQAKGCLTLANTVDGRRDNGIHIDEFLARTAVRVHVHHPKATRRIGGGEKPGRIDVRPRPVATGGQAATHLEGRCARTARIVIAFIQWGDGPHGLIGTAVFVGITNGVGGGGDQAGIVVARFAFLIFKTQARPDTPAGRSAKSGFWSRLAKYTIADAQTRESEGLHQQLRFRTDPGGIRHGHAVEHRPRRGDVGDGSVGLHVIARPGVGEVGGIAPARGGDQ